jgi:hypothetical protein
VGEISRTLQQVLVSSHQPWELCSQQLHCVCGGMSYHKITNTLSLLCLLLLQVAGLPGATTCRPSSGSYCHGLDASSLIFVGRRPASLLASMTQAQLTTLGPKYTCHSLTGECDLSDLSNSKAETFLGSNLSHLFALGPTVHARACQEDLKITS